MKTILLTGGAGFIGSHLAEALLKTGKYRILCIDNFDDFYPAALKEQNLKYLLSHPCFQLIKADIATLSINNLETICKDKEIKVDKIVHLAAKAGVRPSILAPVAYYQTNVTGTLNLLEFARNAGVPHFIFTSSSSVYGDNIHIPWKETLEDLNPISPYASSKMAAEQLGRLYAYLYDIRFTALRLFTVYGPRQRPDLAIHKFYNQIKEGKEITLYGNGSTSRDYTFVEDIVKGIMAAMDFQAEEKFTVFNLGSDQPVSLLQMVKTLEETMQTKAKVNFIEEQPGDVKQTWADISMAKKYLNYHPDTSLKEGIRQFLNWKARGQGKIKKGKLKSC
jgi:UDP-glucuronate 4-epimerase